MYSVKVSVIIPAYQCKDTIRRAVASVLAQSFEDYEIILVDNGSTDGTTQVLQEQAAEDRRIKVIRLETNQRPAGGRNAGVAHATGEWIAFLDADDEWLPDKLEGQVKASSHIPDHAVLLTDGIQHNTTDQSSGAYSKFNGRFLKILQLVEIPQLPNFFSLEGRVRETIFSKNFINTSSVFLKKSTFLNAGGFDERRFGTEDIDLWVRLARTSPFVYWSQETVKRYFRPTSVSNRSEQWLLELIDYQSHCLTSKEYQDLSAITKANLKRFYRYLLVFYGQTGKRKAAVGTYFKSLRAGISIKNLFITCSTFLGARIFTKIHKQYNLERLKSLNHQDVFISQS